MNTETINLEAALYQAPLSRHERVEAAMKSLRAAMIALENHLDLCARDRQVMAASYERYEELARRVAECAGRVTGATWDLSTIPDALLRSEYGRRIKPPAPRARIVQPCVQCGAPLSARERRKPCGKCGKRQPRAVTRMRTIPPPNGV